MKFKTDAIIVPFSSLKGKRIVNDDKYNVLTEFGFMC